MQHFGFAPPEQWTIPWISGRKVSSSFSLPVHRCGWERVPVYLHQLENLLRYLSVLILRVNQFFRYGGIIAFRIFLCRIFAETSWRALVRPLLPIPPLYSFSWVACPWSKPYNASPGRILALFDNVRAFHAAGYGRVYDNGTNQVADISSFATGSIYTYTHFTEFSQQFVCSVDDGGDYFAGNQQFITSDSWRNEDIVYSAYTKKVVDIHNQCVLCNTFPHEIACFFPVHISKGKIWFRRRRHAWCCNIRVPTHYIGNNFAECFWENSFVDVLDGVVHIFFWCAYAPHLYRWLLMG